MSRRLLPLLILLSVLASAPATAAEAVKTLTPAQKQALDIRTGTAQPAAHVPLDGLPARVSVPLTGSAVVTAPYEGVVVELLAREGQAVKQGQLLIEMDPSVAEVNMRAAEANLARAARAVRGTFASADSYSAQLAQAQVALAQAQSDYKRRQSALAGAISGEELGHARDAVAAAQAQVNSARGAMAQAQSGISGVDVAHNPDVLAAEAQLHAAAITLAHMKIVAPVATNWPDPLSSGGRLNA